MNLKGFKYLFKIAPAWFVICKLKMKKITAIVRQKSNRHIDNRIAENEELVNSRKDDEDKNAKANEMSRAMRRESYRKNKTF